MDFELAYCSGPELLGPKDMNLQLLPKVLKKNRFGTESSLHEVARIAENSKGSEFGFRKALYSVNEKRSTQTACQITFKVIA